MQAFNRIIPITRALFSLDVLMQVSPITYGDPVKFLNTAWQFDPSAQSRELLNTVYFLSGGANLSRYACRSGDQIWQKVTSTTE